jgi:hypothetical protein
VALPVDKYRDILASLTVVGEAVWEAKATLEAQAERFLTGLRDLAKTRSR